MNPSRRVVIAFLIAAVVLFLGMLFWPFIVKDIIEPITLVVWLLLRILVLSIHQKYFWYAVIFAACIVLFRLLPQARADVPSETYQETNTTIINIGYWRVLFTYDGQNVRDERILRRELTQLMKALYASKQNTPNDFRIHDALQQGKLPLTENIRTFLFPPESPAPGGWVKKFFESIRKTPRKWIRQWTGQEKAEHHQMIDEILNFMEVSLEIKHDGRKFPQNKH
jgi:hypothetical protein